MQMSGLCADFVCEHRLVGLPRMAINKPNKVEPQQPSLLSAIMSYVAQYHKAVWNTLSRCVFIGPTESPQIYTNIL